MVEVAYGDGQAARIEPHGQSAGGARVRSGVPHQLARHEHCVVARLVELPVLAGRRREQAGATRRGRISIQVEVPDDIPWTIPRYASGGDPVRRERHGVRLARRGCHLLRIPTPTCFRITLGGLFFEVTGGAGVRHLHEVMREAEIDLSGLDPVELDQLPARREYDLTMLLLGIILFGMLVGAAAQLIVGRSAKGVDWGLALAAGVVGSFIGGLLISLLSGDGLAFRPSGIIGSLAGAIIVTLVWHWWRARRAESRR